MTENMKKIYRLPEFGSAILLLLVNLSCSTTNDTVGDNAGNATVKVSLKGSSFEDKGQLEQLASTAGLVSDKEQFQIIDLKGNDNFQIKAELTPANKVNNPAPLSVAQINPVAATETKALQAGIRYKLVVYGEDGSYVMEQDYISGQEASVSPITTLKAENTYNFVVYSIGSATELPVITYTDPNKKTLATASVNNITGESDPMYFSKLMKVSGNNTNYVDITLKHLFSQIIVSLDANDVATFMKITDVSDVSISPHNNMMNLKLSDASTSPSGLAANGKNITFPQITTPARNITALPVLINTPAVTNGNFVIKSLTLKAKAGSTVSVTHQNLVLSNLKITPGVKYNLKLSLMRKDAYLTYRGYPAVRINGFIWMRHNLGANTSLDPDTPVQGLLGNYYQFGRSKVVANANTPASAITPWDSTFPPNNAWNSGTSDVPVKTANDPCPEGWRAPSNIEMFALVSSTTKSLVGTPNELPTNYAVANVLTSTSNASIKMTFPAAGNRRLDNGALEMRGIENGVLYITSVGVSPNGVSIYTFPNNTYSTVSSNLGLPLRCIAESPLQ